MAESLRLKKQEEKQTTPEESFRVVLKDVVEFASKLNDLCDGKIDELIAICELGQTSEAQTKILMSLVAEVK